MERLIENLGLVKQPKLSGGGGGGVYNATQWGFTAPNLNPQLLWSMTIKRPSNSILHEKRRSVKLLGQSPFIVSPNLKVTGLNLTSCDLQLMTRF